VRGWGKGAVGVALALSAGATGAMTGVIAGAATVAVAVAADAVHRRSGRLVPLAVPTQVPQAWSRLFRPTTVAVLYGARLGVGPLTLLRTWLWWPAFLLGVASGPAVAAATGAAFAATRTAAMVLAGEWARVAMAARMARVRALEPAVARALALGAVAAALVLP
jgi:hypothetical protein